MRESRTLLRYKTSMLRSAMSRKIRLRNWSHRHSILMFGMLACSTWKFWMSKISSPKKTSQCRYKKTTSLPRQVLDVSFLWRFTLQSSFISDSHDKFCWDFQGLGVQRTNSKFPFHHLKSCKCLFTHHLPIWKREGIYTALLKSKGNHVLLGLNACTFGAAAVSAISFGKSKVTGVNGAVVERTPRIHFISPWLYLSLSWFCSGVGW